MNHQTLDEWQEGMRFAVVATTRPEPRIVSQHKTPKGALSRQACIKEESYIVGINDDAERDLRNAQVAAVTERLHRLNPQSRR